MRIYLSASWAEKSGIRSIASYLKQCGHEITSSWLYGTEVEPERKLALRDLKDIDNSDLLIGFVPHSDKMVYHTGGRHVEWGYALASNHCRLALVGTPCENIFHKLAAVHYDDLPDLYEAVREGDDIFERAPSHAS